MTQINKTIKAMGIKANVLSRLTSHALSRGVALDASHSKVDATSTGYATEVVRQALGHSRDSMAAGVTDECLEDAEVLVYNLRADASRSLRPLQRSATQHSSRLGRGRPQRKTVKLRLGCVRRKDYLFRKGKMHEQLWHRQK